MEGVVVRRSFGNNETLSVAAMCVSKKTFVCKGFFRLCEEPFLLSRAARLYETVYKMISPADVFGG